METSSPNEKAAGDLFGSAKETVPVIPEVKTEPEPSDEEDAAFAYATYDRFSFIASKVLRFRNKTIDEWIQELAIPKTEKNMTLEDMESLNLYAIGLIEKVNSNYAYAKSAFDLSAIKFNTAYHKEKIAILEECKASKIKAPNADNLEAAALYRLKDIDTAHKVAELFYEFWKSMQSKMKSLDGRLTSISMIHNIEKRNTKYES